MTRGLAFLLALLSACQRSDPGQQCSTFFDCPGGHYCGGGVCRADCVADADCPSGNGCTPNGQCLRVDHLFCEEGDAPTPLQVSALPGRDALLMERLEDDTDSCQWLGTDVGGPASLIGGTCRRLLPVAGVHGLLVSLAGSFAECRPTMTQGDRAFFHGFPLRFEVESAMQAHWSASGVDFQIGRPAAQPWLPDKSAIWASGTLSPAGDFQVTGDGNALYAVALAVYGSDYAGIPRPFQVDVTLTHDGLLKEHLSSTDESLWPSYHLLARRQNGGLMVHYQDDDPDVPVFDFQLRDDLSGRIDDKFDGFSRTVCWRASVEKQPNGEPDVHGTEVTFAAFAGQGTGLPSSCVYPAPVVLQ